MNSCFGFLFAKIFYLPRLRFLSSQCAWPQTPGMFQATPRVWFNPVSGSRHSEGFSGLSRPTPTATAPSDIFTTKRRQAVRARRCIFFSCFADVVRLRLGLILSVGRRAYRLYGLSG